MFLSSVNVYVPVELLSDAAGPWGLLGLLVAGDKQHGHHSPQDSSLGSRALPATTKGFWVAPLFHHADDVRLLLLLLLLQHALPMFVALYVCLDQGHHAAGPAKHEGRIQADGV